jgi:hypothetical protein
MDIQAGDPIPDRLHNVLPSPVRAGPGRDVKKRILGFALAAALIDPPDPAPS